MRHPLAALLLCLLFTPAQAKPSPLVTQYSGDRISAQTADLGRASKARYLYRVKKPKAHAAAPAGRPAAWCGWWLGRHLGMLDRALWLARNWASVGARAHGPQVGVVVVWPHHVGIITGRNSSGWIVKSGNDGRAVRERARSLARVIAYRVL